MLWDKKCKEVHMRKGKFSFIEKEEGLHLAITRRKEKYKYLRRKRASVALLPIFLLFFFIILLEYLGINHHFKEVKVGMEMADLPIAEVKALAEVLGSCKFNSFLKIIQGLELLNGYLFGYGHLLFELPNGAIPILLDLF